MSEKLATCLKVILSDLINSKIARNKPIKYIFDTSSLISELR